MYLIEAKKNDGDLYDDVDHHPIVNQGRDRECLCPGMQTAC
jgi:hypothetical protein